MESWLKSSAGKFNEIYTGSHCVARKRSLLVVLQVLFGLIAIISAIILVVVNYVGVNQLIESGFVTVQEIANINLMFLNIIFIITTVLSLLALWLMRMIKVSNRLSQNFTIFGIGILNLVENY